MNKDNHYSISAVLNPQNRTLQAVAKLIISPKVRTEALTFLLHRDLTISQLQAPMLSTWQSAGKSTFPFTAEAINWELKFAPALMPDTTYELIFHYSGQLLGMPWGVNRLTPEWIELGLYLPWFPWNPDGGLLTYEVNVQIDPKYSVVGAGTAIQQSENIWRLHATQPMLDITVAAAPDLQQIDHIVEQTSISLYFTTCENEAALNTIKDDAIWVLDYYQNWFQDDAKRHIDVVIAPREQGGGYARPGLIMLSTLADHQPEQAPMLFKYIAHEVAHLWWAGAKVDSWQDWLNESFAEFSSLKAFGTKLGTKALESYLAERLQQLPGLPPIRGIDRQAEKAHAVLYTKGAILLFDLEELIGEQKMSTLLRERLRRQVMDTDTFLLLLEEIAGPEAAKQFATWLDC
ncbi:MAG TPA: hypothetical protein DDZ53_11920 [Firmicutes bacterium]|nr:hypothetical protein [Bacillota bacterium]